MISHAVKSRKLPNAWAMWALKDRPEWCSTHVSRTWKLFLDYHIRKKSERDDEGQWEICWKAWVRRQRTETLGVRLKKQWWESAAGIEEKAVELGIMQQEECFCHFRDRVFSACGTGPWSKINPPYRA